jgi:anti-sigma B factor antagonist
MSLEHMSEMCVTDDVGALSVQRRTDVQPPLIVVSGEVDAISGDQVREAVHDIVRDEPSGRVDIDLRGVTFLDSAGIRVLLLCHADARQGDCQFAVVGVSHVAYRILEITGLVDYFGLPAPDPGDALRFGRHGLS